jgi:hypothetical protein
LECAGLTALSLNPGPVLAGGFAFGWSMNMKRLMVGVLLFLIVTNEKQRDMFSSEVM